MRWSLMKKVGQVARMKSAPLTTPANKGFEQLIQKRSPQKSVQQAFLSGMSGGWVLHVPSMNSADIVHWPCTSPVQMNKCQSDVRNLCITARNLSTVTQRRASQEKFEPSKFTPVYKFSYIVPFHVVCRVKIYQTALMLGAVPLVGYLQTQDLVSSMFMYSFTAVLSLAAVMLYIMGEFFRRVIGLLSVDESMSLVLISHLTFWGRRRDIIVDAKDIVPLLDMSENLEELFVLLKFYNSKDTFFLFHRHGIIDESKFWKLLS